MGLMIKFSSIGGGDGGRSRVFLKLFYGTKRRMVNERILNLESFHFPSEITQVFY